MSVYHPRRSLPSAGCLPGPTPGAGDAPWPGQREQNEQECAAEAMPGCGLRKPSGAARKPAVAAASWPGTPPLLSLAQNQPLRLWGSERLAGGWGGHCSANLPFLLFEIKDSE